MRLMATRGMCSLLVLFVMAACNTVFAETLQGTFAFEKKAPKVALVYFSEDTSLSDGVKTVIDQQDKQFMQRLYVTSKGSHAIFKNSDSINHNIFADDKKADVKFDVGLINPGGSTVHEVEWDDKAVKCSCKIHPRMKTWIASIQSKYYKIIEFEKGKKELTFEMNSFPENLTKIKVWLPNYAPIELSVGQGESKDVELTKKGKKKGTLTLARK